MGTGVLGVLYVCVIEDFELRTVYSVSSVSCSNLYLIIRWWQFIWGKSNLYVTDGSFMPTGGSAPHTFTIYANSFRIADHLKRILA